MEIFEKLSDSVIKSVETKVVETQYNKDHLLMQKKMLEDMIVANQKELNRINTLLDEFVKVITK
jgi:hypothetical protein